MIIRFTYLASAFSFAAAASKSAKTPGTPPPDAAKAGKSTASKSSKSKTGSEYFIAPFSCPQSCISAQGYELSSHLLDDAVSECDASDGYQKWKVHQSGAFLKFESAAPNYGGMCLAALHQDPSHESNSRGGFAHLSSLGSCASIALETVPLFSEVDANEVCSGQLLGLADCSHPGSFWYNTGGQYLSALCWNQGVSAALSVDEGCTDLTVASDSTDLTASETFMLMESD